MEKYEADYHSIWKIKKRLYLPTRRLVEEYMVKGRSLYLYDSFYELSTLSFLQI